MVEVSHHISSAVVITRSDLEDDVVAGISSLEGVEIHGRGRGKIVVTIEGPTAGFLGDMLIRMSTLDGVVAAHMVFEQAIAEDEERPDDVRNYTA